jgi:hypothetical protein
MSVGIERRGCTGEYDPKNYPARLETGKIFFTADVNSCRHLPQPPRFLYSHKRDVSFRDELPLFLIARDRPRLDVQRYQYNVVPTRIRSAYTQMTSATHTGFVNVIASAATVAVLPIARVCAKMSISPRSPEHREIPVADLLL